VVHRERLSRVAHREVSRRAAANSPSAPDRIAPFLGKLQKSYTPKDLRGSLCPLESALAGFWPISHNSLKSNNYKPCGINTYAFSRRKPFTFNTYTKTPGGEGARSSLACRAEVRSLPAAADEGGPLITRHFPMPLSRVAPCRAVPSENVGRESGVEPPHSTWGIRVRHTHHSSLAISHLPRRSLGLATSVGRESRSESGRMSSASSDLVGKAGPAFPDLRRVCYKHRSMFRPAGEGERAVQASAGKAGAQHSRAGRPGEPHASSFCPACSAQLEPRRCKLICSRCGYYMSCSDYI